jgi:two-component system response regulator MtrA
VGAPRVLIVDDDVALAEMLGLVLRREGFIPSVVTSGSAALAAIRRENPDVVLLDLMLPGRDGVDVCRDLRAESDVPVIMLTARSDTIDIVRGLEVGADDYVVKPFKPAELVARVKARLRRGPDEPALSLSVVDLDVDVGRHKVRRGSSTLSLTPLEFDLLRALAQEPRRVWTREALLQHVWGYRHAGDTRLVNVHVQRLRAKVEHDPEHPQVVVTVRGVGYRAGPP